MIGKKIEKFYNKKYELESVKHLIYWSDFQIGHPNCIMSMESMTEIYEGKNQNKPKSWYNLLFSGMG